MCNAWNHDPSCLCGFGGDTAWARPGGTADYGIPLTLRRTGHRLIASYDREDFCRPSHCHYCGAPVFFVRHNGGSVWFNRLEQPWPKHPCYYPPVPRGQVAVADPFVEHLRSFAPDDPAMFLALVVEGSLTANRWIRFYKVRTSDDEEITIGLESSMHPDNYVGKYVALSYRSPRMVLLGSSGAARVFFAATSLKLRKGSRCRHPEFGPGTILALEPSRQPRTLVVEFERTATFAASKGLEARLEHGAAATGERLMGLQNAGKRQVLATFGRVRRVPLKGLFLNIDPTPALGG